MCGCAKCYQDQRVCVLTNTSLIMNCATVLCDCTTWELILSPKCLGVCRHTFKAIRCYAFFICKEKLIRRCCCRRARHLMISQTQHIHLVSESQITFKKLALTLNSMYFSFKLLSQCLSHALVSAHCCKTVLSMYWKWEDGANDGLHSQRIMDIIPGSLQWSSH